MFAYLLTAIAGPLTLDNSGEESWSETWTAIADLSDGSYALVQYLFTNAGFGDGNAACRALWVPAGGAGVNGADKAGSDWTATETQVDVADCSLRVADGQTRFTAVTDAVTLDLTLDREARAHQAPDGRVVASDGTWYTSEVLVPWAEATVVTSGRTLTGMGYLDHTRSTTMLPKIATGWYRFRGYYGDTVFLVQARMPADGGAAVGWTWGTGGTSALSDFTVLSTAPVTLAVGDAQVVAGEQLFQYKPAEQYGLLGDLAKPFVGDPTTTTYRATMSLPDGGEVRGTLEVQTLQ